MAFSHTTCMARLTCLLPSSHLNELTLYHTHARRKQSDYYSISIESMVIRKKGMTLLLHFESTVGAQSITYFAEKIIFQTAHHWAISHAVSSHALDIDYSSEWHSPSIKKPPPSAPLPDQRQSLLEGCCWC